MALRIFWLPQDMHVAVNESNSHTSRCPEHTRPTATFNVRANYLHACREPLLPIGACHSKLNLEDFLARSEGFLSWPIVSLGDVSRKERFRANELNVNRVDPFVQIEVECHSGIRNRRGESLVRP